MFEVIPKTKRSQAILFEDLNLLWRNRKDISSFKVFRFVIKLQDKDTVLNFKMAYLT